MLFCCRGVSVQIARRVISVICHEDASKHGLCRFLLQFKRSKNLELFYKIIEKLRICGLRCPIDPNVDMPNSNKILLNATTAFLQAGEKRNFSIKKRQFDPATLFSTLKNYGCSDIGKTGYDAWTEVMLSYTDFPDFTMLMALLRKPACCLLRFE